MELQLQMFEYMIGLKKQPLQMFIQDRVDGPTVTDICIGQG